MIIEIILLLLAFPAGYLIRWMAKDEIKAGRKWFVALICLFSVIGLIFLLNGTYYVALTSLFMIIVAGISLIKSKV